MRFLLLQVRDAQDPMRQQEIGCFARALECEAADLVPFDLLTAAPSRRNSPRSTRCWLAAVATTRPPAPAPGSSERSTDSARLPP